ncbi:MAG: DUF4167 domain-containing protein [Nitratireductor sp.]|nr:DUF4167 domain-containing protein [Nitratireductor sp.]
MRQQQNNKNRMRGRGRNKPSNSLNRNYESNGPDVKIRGNAAHIAEKYSTLARDAQSSGDSVIAENYLQHAEHYNRIVLAAQAQREEAQANRARHNDAGQDDQPDVNDDDRAETNAAGNREESGDDGDVRQASRRGRNGRAPRQREDADGNEDSAMEADAEEASESMAAEANGDAGNGDEAPRKPARTRRTTRSKPQPSGGMTEDAASLPQGLLGNDAGQTVGAED